MNRRGRYGRGAAATLAAALIVCLAAAGDDWLHLGRDGWRSRTSPETITLPLAPAWTAVGTAAHDASPITVDGRVIVADRDGLVRAYRESNGAHVWTFDTEESVIATPAAGNGRVYVMATDGTLHALRLSDGGPLWSLEVGGTNRASPALVNGTLYLCSSFPNRKVVALDPATASVIWEAPVAQVCDSSPAVAGGRVLVGANDGSLSAFDAATGAPVWTYSGGGIVKLSSPLVDGASIYFLPGGSDFRLHRVDLDDAQWAAANWTVALTDPAPPPPANTYDTSLATSSPVLAGGRVVVLARFDYALDLDLDGTIETYRLREFLIGVDPVARTVAWQMLLASRDVPDYNGIPPLNVCPTPAVAGGLLFAASSLDPVVEVRNAVDGSPAGSAATHAPGLASPTIANGRVYQATSTGRLHAFQGANAPPAPPTANFAPAPGADVDSNTPALSWDPASDPDDAAATLRYLVRLDSDGEILQDWAFETTTPAGTATATPTALADDAVFVWAVRTQDPSGAFSAWSALQTFSVNLAPQPPGALTAVPGSGKVTLAWLPSPSSNVTDYLVSHGPVGGAFGPETAVGLVLTTEVSGLTNGTAYMFRIRARDAENDVSQGETTTATPVSLISIGGVDYGSLEDALDAALPGETVTLAAGTFLLDRGLVLPAGVSLRGANARDTRLIAQDRFTMLRLNQPTSGAVPVVVQGLFLSGGSIGIETNGVDITLLNLVLADMSDAGVDVNGESAVTAFHLTVFGAVNAGVRSAGDVALRNSILDSNGRGVRSIGGTFASSYNAFHANTVAHYDGVTPGPGDIMVQPSYTDPPNGDFTILKGSPTIDAGDLNDPYGLEPTPHGWWVNQGAFGNTPLAAASSSNYPPSRGGGKGWCSLAAASDAPPLRVPWMLLAAAALLFLARRYRSMTMR